MSTTMNILILYDHHEIHVKTIADHLQSFRRFSSHNVYYVSSFAKCHFDLDYFDAVVVHFSVRVCFPGRVSSSFQQALRAYQGLKILFIQDEYDHTNAAREAILDLGIGLVFTCVPEESIAKVYPPDRFAGVQFVNVLTGYVPIELGQLNAFAPIRERSILIGYRGRNLGYWYGDLGQEKQHIGMRMKEICDARNLSTDIAWDEHDRIYGDAWLDFLGRCKATLATESGSNVFDFDGTLAATVQDEVRRNPNVCYEEIRDKHLIGHEGTIEMNQISPKIFEAAACKTALVVFEGRYSGVLEPSKHCIVLKKDFSNVDDVLAMLHDDAFLEAMTERAYADLIASGQYSYQAFVGTVDEALARNMRVIERAPVAWLPLPPADAVPAFRDAYQKNFEPHLLKRMWSYMPGFLQGALSREGMQRVWSWFPSPIRSLCQPLFQLLRRIVKPAH